jgi:hypothetical protein
MARDAGSGTARTWMGVNSATPLKLDTKPIKLTGPVGIGVLILSQP